MISENRIPMTKVGDQGFTIEALRITAQKVETTLTFYSDTQDEAIAEAEQLDGFTRRVVRAQAVAFSGKKPMVKAEVVAFWKFKGLTPDGKPIILREI